jgi:hypothetical protein
MENSIISNIITTTGVGVVVESCRIETMELVTILTLCKAAYQELSPKVNMDMHLFLSDLENQIGYAREDREVVVSGRQISNMVFFLNTRIESCLKKKELLKAEGVEMPEGRGLGWVRENGKWRFYGYDQNTMDKMINYKDLLLSVLIGSINFQA